MSEAVPAGLGEPALGARQSVLQSLSLSSCKMHILRVLLEWGSVRWSYYCCYRFCLFPELVLFFKPFS